MQSQRARTHWSCFFVFSFSRDDDDDDEFLPPRTMSEPKPGLDDDDEPAGQHLDMNELFGSSDDDADDDAGNRPLQSSLHHSIMDIPTSLHDALPPSRNHLAKLPPSVRIIPEAFREDDVSSSQLDKHDIRWRYGLDDRTSKLVRESNARIVTWSDGSRTLHVGGNEAVYQMKAIDISKDETYLYASHARLIQCQGKLRDKLMFNPISVKQAKTAKSQPSKSVKVKQTATLVDPVKEREAKERSEEARIREKEKLAEKQRQMERNAILKDPKFARKSYHGTRGLSAAFLEDDDEGGGELAVNEEEYDEDDGWLLGDEDEEEEGEEEIEDAEDVGAGVDGTAGERGNAGNNADAADALRTMPGPDVERRNEASLMGIMVEGKATDQGIGGEPKKKRTVISSDSEDD